ncbi:MAG TPA: hypothetical protein VGM18_08225 [Candidatus Sulfotelmatobacter sp.]
MKTALAAARSLVVVFSALVLLSNLSLTAQAQSATQNTVPRLVRFSGTASDLNGNPMTGAVGITFLLYAEQTGGAPLWLETQNVQADANGHYSVLLGSAKPDGLPAELFTSEQARWVGVQISGQNERTRFLLVSAPYALKAGDAETIGGLPPSAFMLAPSTSGATSVSSSITGTNAARPGSTSGVLTNLPALGGSGTTNFVPLWTSSSTLGNSVLFQSVGKFVGVNTTSPQAQLDSVSTSKWAVRGLAQGSTKGVVGVLGLAQSPSAANIGVQGVTNSATGVGGDFENMSPTGGDILHAEASGGTRVLTLNTGSGTTGTPVLTVTAGELYPNYVPSTSDAVVGTGGNLGPTSGAGGVFTGGQNLNFISPGFGVVANGGDNDDSLTVSGDGILAAPGNDCCGGGTGLAGNFLGDIQTEGTNNSSSSAFKIDHPLDPASKYLYHSSVESPDMKNIYDGVVRLNDRGEATVALPEYFGTLNGDFRYQLTSIGAPGPNLYVAEELVNNQFKIAGGAPGAKVSWQVTGIRQDAWANAHRIQPEVAKPPIERGYYLHPELFGASEERSVNWARHPREMQRRKEMRHHAGIAPTKQVR